MAIVIAILKFIGILLLVLLGIIVIPVFFAPVRYEVKCKTEETLQVEYKVFWLWRAVALRGDFSESDIKFYIFGINAQNIKDFFSRKPKEKKTDRVVPPEESTVQMVDEFYDDSDSRVKRNEWKDVDIETDYEEEEEKPKAKKKQGKKSFPFERISSIINFIRDNENKNGFRKVKKEFVDLVRHIMPNKVRGRVRFGTGDPCTTGWLLGGISMFSIAYMEELRIIPDFEEKILEADGFLKGRLRLLYLVRLIIRGYLDEDIRKVLSKVMEFI